jgi:hypothetical protein
MTTRNVIDRLQFMIDTNHSSELEVDFCASHFSEFEILTFADHPFGILSAIISSSSLKLKDEDSLYELIKYRADQNPEFSSLFAFVRFEYLSLESIQSFTEYISNSFDCLTFPIWSAFRCRLELPVSPTGMNDRSCANSIVCPYIACSPLNGILRYLTKRYGGNVCDKGIINITSIGTYLIHGSQIYFEKQLAAPENPRAFWTANVPDSWICYDFKNAKITPSHYSIRAGDSPTCRYLRTWSLEGSLDGGQTWIAIDHRENDTEINAPAAIGTYEVKAQSTVQMIRIRQSGKDSCDTNHLLLTGFELFGELTNLE